MSKDLSEDFEPEPEPDPELSDDSEDSEEPEDPSSEIIQFTDLDNKTVSQHRKAYVIWINEEFYKRLQKLNCKRPKTEKPITVSKSKNSICQ